MMRLHITLTSPYARLARIMVIEKHLEHRVEVIEAQTRVIDSPYYAVNPTGRVPYLERDDGGAPLEDSPLICAYLDTLDGPPSLQPPAPGADAWAYPRLESNARSLLDGLGVWSRELSRPIDESSPITLAHEHARAWRVLPLWEDAVRDEPALGGDLNLAQLTLAVGLDMDRRLKGFQWRAKFPALDAWATDMAARPSLKATLPPYSPR